jgi:hypothetical protein
MLMYKHVPNGRGHLGRPRKRWRKQHPCKRGQTWNSLNLVVDNVDGGDEV